MKATARLHNCIVASLVALLPATAALAQTDRLDDLFARLKDAEPDAAMRIEREITLELSKSGSPSMDLLLQRGRDALDAGEVQAALEHLGALTDHDPEFGEGWSVYAMALYQAGNTGMAIDALSRALRIEPRNYEALTGLGSIMEESNRPELALKAYRLGLDLNPQQADLKDAVKRIETDLAGQDI